MILEEATENAEYLKEADMMVLANMGDSNGCSETWTDLFRKNGMENQEIADQIPLAVQNPEIICAYAPGKHTCHGDSGGPIFLLENNRYVCHFFSLL